MSATFDRLEAIPVAESRAVGCLTGAGDVADSSLPAMAHLVEANVTEH